MKLSCPRCAPKDPSGECRTAIVRAGFFKRKSDSKKIQRYHCRLCFKFFSSATFHPCFRQHKRHFNFKINRSLCSGVSQRRIALLFHLSRTTVSRKLCFLGIRAEEELKRINEKRGVVEVIEFDDLETFEHTKYKPLSVTLAVQFKTRRILGAEVSKMAAKGKLAEFAYKKYGLRRDERKAGRRRLFQKIKPFVHPQALIKSDENPHYVEDVKAYFPQAFHERHKGQRGSVTGQGELKKIRFDPLFSLNHTCAMLRANINRLFRKTWCTTKKPERLQFHLAIYLVFHNSFLIDSG